MRVGRSLATTPRLVFPSKRCLGSTDLLICIGEMCATASTSEDKHGHGHGQNERFDRNGTATWLADKILQRGLLQLLHTSELTTRPLEQGFVIKDLVKKNRLWFGEQHGSEFPLSQLVNDIR